AHKDELVELGTFADTGANTVTFVPGDHDAALVFPEVWARVLGATHSSRNRVYFSIRGYWMSDDGLIYADHGHQMDAMNAFEHWPKPVRPDGHLERPWGEQFVAQFYNPYEGTYETIDNITSELVALDYASTAKKTIGVIRAFQSFLGLFVFRTTLTQKIGALG